MELLLFEPEIPPNTGNIARLCAGTGIRLNLVEPLGFSLEDRYLKRAGLDYWPHVDIRVWPDLAAFLKESPPNRRLVMSSARQGVNIQDFEFMVDDVIVLGPETRGLPKEVMGMADARVRIPIRNTIRSLNLSTAAGILLYQAMIRTGTLPE